MDATTFLRAPLSPSVYRKQSFYHSMNTESLKGYSLSFVYCSSNPIYAGAHRGYDTAAILDTNLPKTLATHHGKCGCSANGSSLHHADLCWHW